MKPTIKPTIVIYHKNCADGFGAALAVRFSMYKSQLEHTTFLPAHHKDDAPDVTGKRVIIVDFSYSRDVLLEMSKKADSILVIDHHKSAQENLKGLDFCRFDMSKSGAMLAWEYFHTNPAPLLFHYIQDRDLWKWELPKSKEVSAAIRSYPMTFEVWDRWVAHTSDDQEIIDGLAKEGEAILRYQEQQIATKLAGERGFIEIQDYEVPIINTTSLISEIVGELAKDYPFAMSYFDLPHKRVFSLRSNRNNPDAVDVSKIANLYGGGGHANAAGFSLDRSICNAMTETLY